MKKYFITGLAILLPVALTIEIIIFIVNLLTEPFAGMIIDILTATGNSDTHGFLWLSPQQTLRFVSQILILVGLFFITILLGFLTRLFFFNWLLRLGDYILHRIPLVNKVYKTMQEIIKALFYSPAKSFKQVVLVPFPSDQSYTIGLLSGDSMPACSEALKKEMVPVFIPTAPNPTSGYLVMFEREKIHFLDLKVEDALKYVISCGAIKVNLPENTSE